MATKRSPKLICRRTYLFWLFCLFNFVGLLAQSNANFSVEGDVYSGDPTIDTDDWFSGITGLGVIDEDSTAVFQNRITTGQNTAFYTGMRQDYYSLGSNYLWYDAVYGHDHISLDSNKNPIDDVTVFNSGRNSDNPQNWTITGANIPSKSDLLDVYMHLRRDGSQASDSLWLLVGASTIDNGGSHYIDIEFYVTDLKTNGGTFTNFGPDEGHTAWIFDLSGNVVQIGDMDLGLDYSGSSVLATDVRIWVSRSDFQNNVGFPYLDFYSETATSSFGYARINSNGFVLKSTNSAVTTGPPWGTYNNGLIPTSNYAQHALAEMGLNLTGIGMDPAVIFGSDSMCHYPYKALLVKSRVTSSFEAKLKDFAGPFPLLAANEPLPDTSIASPPVLDSCNPGNEPLLYANTNYPDKEYQWTSKSPGVTFPNGDTVISGIGLNSVAINRPGIYELNIIPSENCPADPQRAQTTLVKSTPCAVDDSVLAEADNSVVIEVWPNDVDLDNNIVPISINNTGLTPPSNGSVIFGPTGEITYTPNPGFMGSDSFEYRICDEDGYCDIGMVNIDVVSPLPPPFEDSDGDGVLDKDDLDDDNDGIPDLVEQGIIIDNSQPACGGETELDFSSPAVLISGTDLQQGAIYRIANVTAGVDALVSVTQIYNATIYNIDNNGSDAHAFRPDTQFSFVNAGDQAMIEYKLRFVAAGGFTPVVIDKFFMNFNDIDGTPSFAEQTWALNPTSYVISNPTELTMYTDGKWVVGTAGTTTYGGASNANPQVNFGANYDSKSEMTIRVGAVARVAGANAIYRLHHIEFKCITNYVNPEVYGMDFDYDGISNHLDLDGDNDGIYDSVEAGHGQSQSGGITNGPYGANGLADSVENVPESGLLNYTIDDVDGSEGFDYLDLDSDADGCSDANEAYADPNAEGGDNWFYGVGNPPPVSNLGTVNAASYITPVDNDNNGTPEYQEFDSPQILSQPQDETICIGDTVQFNVQANNADSYQWQKSSGGIWTDISDGGIYSGASTDTLTLTNTPSSENGNEFRVLVSNSLFICSVFSLPATLTISSPNVIANASSTTINSGESVTLTGSGASTYVWDQGISDGDTVILYATTTFTVTGTDIDGCTNTDQVTVIVNADADLSLNKFPDNTTPNVGDTVLFTIELTNSGPDPATNIIVEDILPTGYTLIDINNGGTIAGNRLQWNVPFLDIGTVQLTYTVEINIPTLGIDEYKNVAQIVDVDQSDPDSTVNNDNGDQSEDDEASFVTPTPMVDIEITKAVEPLSAKIGDTVVFTVTVENLGEYIATNIDIEDPLPDGYSINEVNTNVGNYDSGNGIWHIPMLPPGEKGVLNMGVTIQNGSDYTNVATMVYVDQLDPQPENDTSSIGINPFDDNCLVVYNEFSPNNDGRNDFLYIECIETYPENYIQIFDRWGSLVYEKKGYNNEWDGQRTTDSMLGKERELPVGTYFYILSLDDTRNNDRTGWIYISR